MQPAMEVCKTSLKLIKRNPDPNEEQLEYWLEAVGVIQDELVEDQPEISRYKKNIRMSYIYALLECLDK